MKQAEGARARRNPSANESEALHVLSLSQPSAQGALCSVQWGTLGAGEGPST